MMQSHTSQMGYIAFTISMAYICTIYFAKLKIIMYLCTNKKKEI